ncbi:glycosyltransferase family 2 protein [Agromyces sp. NPDC056965]|uniref:glycosyltransferase family 2 protein n=1 Tax=Agromyces sp. NPDC056965 TaxID=3345983 RepID=UPI0036407C8C
MTDRVVAPAISVALCTHNGERFLEAQVRSILTQSVAPTEIIVSDDASSDSTVALIERLAMESGSITIRVLRNSVPLGVAANFEQAIAAASGDLIALCDQDDVWHHRKIERMIAALSARPGLMLIGTDARIVDEVGRPDGSTLFETLGVDAAERARMHAGDGLRVLLRRNIVTGATVVLRRELVALAEPFPHGWVHDEWLAIIAAATAEIDLIEEPLIDYRQHDANQIGATSLTWRGRIDRLRTPRADRNARLLARATALADRMPLLSPPASDEALRGAAEKLAHEQVRSALPARRRKRIKSIVREWRTGRYSTCGLGVQDVVRDLVQPAG